MLPTRVWLRAPLSDASDASQLSFSSLNHVRLPIGYWAWQVGPGEPFIQGERASNVVMDRAAGCALVWSIASESSSNGLALTFESTQANFRTFARLSLGQKVTD